ncbi:MAG: hypothetical protein KatS3mg058_0416 [Roseiflexus sp.]|nr:MAG: hypothetical protein KatS3mg058_0416 [Roseiflexus sp.]
MERRLLHHGVLPNLDRQRMRRRERLLQSQTPMVNETLSLT